MSDKRLYYTASVEFPGLAERAALSGAVRLDSDVYPELASQYEKAYDLVDGALSAANLNPQNIIITEKPL